MKTSTVKLELEKIHPELTTTNMTVCSLEKVFLGSPHHLDFNQLKRLAKGKGIAIKGRTKREYIDQLETALAQ